MKLEALPEDVAQLKRLVLDEHQRADDEHQRAELYKFKFENLARVHFGASSEKRNDADGQQLLFELPARPEAAAIQPAAESATEDAEPKKHGGGRKPLPKDLPRERIEHTLPEEQRKCSCCGETMQPFGEETSEQLEYIPASLKVIEHARIKYACRACQEKPAVAPPRVVKKVLCPARLRRIPPQFNWTIFSGVEKVEFEAQSKLTELKIEILGFQIREATAFIKILWITSDAGITAIRSGEFDGFDFGSDPENPRPLDRQPDDSTSYKTSYNRSENFVSKRINAGKKKASFRSRFHR